MKNHYLLKYIIMAVIVFFLASASQANWIKYEGKNSIPYTQNTENTHQSKSDSLPAGITKDWMKTLIDENGKRIINEEDPETDALQQNTFDGVVAGDEYGRSVSSAGDVNGDGFDDIIIGAPKNNAGGISSGRAYIFFGGTVIDNSADVILTGGAVNNYFGSSVSGAGDVNSDGYDDVIVGAYGYNSFTGRAYIYYGGANMNSVADVIMTGVSPGNNFGSSVSSAGDVNGDGFSDVIAGAYGINANTGKAYVYFGGSTMNNVIDVTLNGESSQSYFGSSVSGAGDVNGDGYADAICGAYGYNSDIGKAYIFYGGISMDNVSDVIMFGNAITDFFGASVSNAGDVNDDGYSDVIIGAYGYSSLIGRAYIYYGGASMDGAADVTMTGESSINLFGYSVSEAGDVNGDGFADVYVGAYGYSTSEGRAYIYYGGASMNNVVDIYMTGDTTLNYFGYSVSSGGDVNGDGFSDVIIGAFGYSLSKGRAYVYTNTMSGEDIADLSLSPLGPYELFGSCVSDAGDVNGDGYDDVIIGAYNYSSPGNTYNGRAYIFFGGVIMDTTADVIMTGVSYYESFGISVSCAGDVNHDGYDDVVVGADHYSGGIGRAYIYFGGATMNSIPDVTMTGEGQSAFGCSVSSAGDVNGDGYSDVIVGARSYSSNGRCYIYFGSSAMDNAADVIITGIAFSYYVGFTVSSAGDVNGDGYSDVITGSTFPESALVFYGGQSMDNTPDIIFSEPLASQYGWSVSDAGDMNGDGFSDIIVGAYNSEQCFIYFGGTIMNNTADFIIQGDTNTYFGIPVSAAGDLNNDGFSDVIVGGEGRNFLPLGKANIFFGGKYMDNVSDIVLTKAGTSYNGFSNSVSSAGDVNGDGISDIIVGAYSKAYIYLSSPPDNRKNLLLFGAIQGMYDPVLDTEVPDTIKVYLRNSTSPFARVDSSKNILLGPLAGQQFLFRNARNSTPYYVEVTHRNALTTWSATPVTFVNSDASIAFSVDAIYAYGNNELQVDSNPYNVFAFYSGDVNQDGAIDLTDVLFIYNDANSFTSGYVVTDLTGNNAVDLADLIMSYNNSVGFVNVIKP